MRDCIKAKFKQYDWLIAGILILIAFFGSALWKSGIPLVVVFGGVQAYYGLFKM